jgi:5'(3')-deoxyribonucleotidase
MKREAVAIDLDDVLASHVESFVAFSNANYGTNLGVEDYNDHWADLWHVEYDEIERRAAEFHIPETVAAFNVKEEARKALQQISASRDLYIVTARSQKLADTTTDWVDKYFKGLFKGVHLLSVWEPNNTITKLDICKQIGASCLIDDLPRHCNLAAEGGVDAILFGDYAWNRNEAISNGVTRCKSWDEVLAYFGIDE